MDMKQRNKPSQFQKKVLVTAMFTGFLSLSPQIAGAAHIEPSWIHTKSYLDAGVWSKIVTQDTCFSASPKSLLTVEPVMEEGQRRYKISQFFDPNVAKDLYAKPLEKQIQEHKIVGKKFCNGVVSISDMKLPFAKTDHIQDANDGLLLVDSARRGLLDVLEHLYVMSNLAMQGASGVYSSSQLANLDTLFQANLAEIDHISNYVKFAGMSLLNVSESAALVPIHHNQQTVRVSLYNTTTGTAGLNIHTLSVNTNTHSQQALGDLNTAFYTVNRALFNLEADEVSLNTAAKQDAATTFVDVRTDDFIVQHKQSTTAASE